MRILGQGASVGFLAATLILPASVGATAISPVAYSSSPSGAPTLEAPGPPEAVPGEILVRYRPGVRATDRAEARRVSDVDLVRGLLLPRLQLVRAEPGQTVGRAIAELEARPEVLYAEPNFFRSVSATPDDTRFGELWGLHNTGQTVNGTAGTADADIDAPEAWDTQTGSAGVVVAVIDTGVAYDHPDIAGQVWANPGETGGGKETNGLDDDSNGFIDDHRGWDFANDDNDPRDGHDHGTHVSGTIGGIGNNAAGIAGVSWDVTIMPVQVCGTIGYCASSDTVDGAVYAGANGADIANMSLGDTNFSQAERDAIAAAPDTLFAIAAGNENVDNDTLPSYPCNHPLDNIICVAASDQDDARAGFSNYGSESVDLAAPGTDILSSITAFDTIFSDDFEGAAKWDYVDESAPDAAKWERISTASWSPSHSITDSSGGNYGASQDVRVTTTTPFNLAGRTECRVEYMLRILSFTGQDQLHVQASTSPSSGFADLPPPNNVWDGSSSGNFIGPVGTDLGPTYEGQGTVYLRFRFLTSATSHTDGAYIDDVQVRCPKSTYAGTEYEFFNGTSMATPHVAGAAALLKAKDPTASPGQLKAALMSTVNPLPAFDGITVTGGRLNVAAALAAITTTPEPAPSSQAALDTTFSSDGKSTTAFSGADKAFGIARQADGKIVMVGSAPGSSGTDFAVARYNTDGTLDTTFDGDGVVTTTVGSGSGNDEAHAVAIQSDDKIVVAGAANNSNDDFAVVRYNTDGSLDTTFSADGKAFADNSFDIGWALALQSDGSVVVAGKTGAIPDSMVTRFTTAGVLDTTFDTDGKVITAVGVSLQDDQYHGVALQGDGKIVATGFVEVGAGVNNDFALVRYNANGSLDTNADADPGTHFDTDGVVITPMSTGTGNDEANAVVIQPDGKIVAAGEAPRSAVDRFALARYNADGSLDTSFSGDGKLRTTVSPVSLSSRAFALGLQADGKLVAAGEATGRVASANSLEFGLARYNTDGTLDTSFNGDGKLIVPIAPDPEQDTARGLVILPGSGYVAGGYSDMAAGGSVDFDFSIARFKGEADAAAPALPRLTDTDPDSPAGDTTPMIKGSAEAGSTVRLYTTGDCSGAQAAQGSAAAFRSPGLGVTVPDGSTTFRATATDASGNLSGCSDPITYVVDLTPPDTTITGGPTGATNDNTPSFTFSSTKGDSTFQCKVDSGSFASCTSPHTTSALTDGAHTFEVKATDAGGNPDPSPASRAFTVDTVAPQTQIDSAPLNFTTDNTPTWTFSSNEAVGSTQCRILPASFGACSGPGIGTHTSGPLADGEYTFEARVIDLAGNPDPSPAQDTFTVDTDPPQTTIDSGPSGPTNDTTPTFTFSSDEGGGLFLCRVDADSFGACSGPSNAHTPPSPLSQGVHTFEVRHTDPAGNSDATPASRSFTVDTDPPNSMIDTGPSGPTNDSTPTFTFSSTEGSSTFQCKVDSGSFAPCTSPHTTAVLGDGAHTFEVKATDPAGNTDGSTASQSFTVDTGLPTDPTLSSPSHTTNVASNDPTVDIAFSGAADAGGTGVDGFSYLWDTSPATVPDTTKEAEQDAPGTTSPILADGTSHWFHLRTRDNAGNWTSTVHFGPFVIEATPPETTIDTGPTGLTNDNTPTFTFSSTELGSTFQCRVDSNAFAACTSPHTTAVLADGPHTFEVKAIDPAGNTDGSPSSRSFTVDTFVPVRRTDGAIKVGGGAFVGNDIYNTTAASQTRTARARRGQTKTFTIRVQNDGNVMDSFRLQGKRGSSTFVVKYLLGGVNITSLVVAGSYTIANVAPGAAVDIVLKIKPKATAAIGSSKAILATATSIGAPGVADAVKAKVRVKSA